MGLNGVVDVGVVRIAADGRAADVGNPQLGDVLILNGIGVLHLVRSPVSRTQLQVVDDRAQGRPISIIINRVTASFNSRNQRHKAVETDFRLPTAEHVHLALGNIKCNGTSLALIGELSTDKVQRAGSSGLNLDSHRISSLQDRIGIEARRMDGDIARPEELVAGLHRAVFVEETTAPAGGEPTITVVAQANIDKGIQGALGPNADGDAGTAFAHVGYAALGQRNPAGCALVRSTFIAMSIVVSAGVRLDLAANEGVEGRGSTGVDALGLEDVTADMCVGVGIGAVVVDYISNLTAGFAGVDQNTVQRMFRDINVGCHRYLSFM